MEVVIFIGIQASGKSTFFKQRFSDTHIRINLDMLRTKHREKLLTDACFEAKQSFVIDKTNPTAAEREKYIRAAKTHKFSVTGFYFGTNLTDALGRNAGRSGKSRIDERGIRATSAKLELPTWAEGFDKLFYVRIAENGEFAVEDWKDEI